MTISVLHIITSEATGGLETYALQLISKLEKEGVRTGVYCLKNSIVGQKMVASGLKVYPAHKRSKFSIKDIREVLSLAKKEKYSIIQAHTNKDMWLGSWVVLFSPKIKLIYNLYMSVVAKNDFIHRFIYSRIAALVTTSKIINQEVKKHYPIKSSVIKLIRYGRDIEQYVFDEGKRNSIRSQWNASQQSLVVGTICRIDKTKGVREFAASFLLLPKEQQSTVQYWIIGDKTVHHQEPDGTIVYEQQAEEAFQYLHHFIAKNDLGQSIKLIPYQPDLVGYLNAIDVFVLASYREMYSLAVIDAMLMEKLVIGTKAGGTPEQLGHGTRGIVVKPRSGIALAHGIGHAITQFHLLTTKAKDAKAWAVAKHAWERTTKNYLNLYSELLARSQANNHKK